MIKDKESLFELMDKFEKSELSELTLKIDEQLIKMKKGGDQIVHSMPFPGMAQAAAPAPVGHVSTPSAAPAVAVEDGEVISAPLVGTFYRSPAPDANSFVEVGSKVKAGDTLCILEAMKIMNELEAEFDCEIIEIIHESGTLAEFGSPLFKVKRV